MAYKALVHEGGRIKELPSSQFLYLTNMAVGREFLSGTLSTNDTFDVEVILNNPMPDINFSVTASLVGSGENVNSISIVGIVDITTEVVTVRIKSSAEDINLTGLTIHVIAIYG